MGKPMLPFDEFKVIRNTMKSNPQDKEKGELQRDYYERLIHDFNISRSRATLQNIERSMIDTDSVEEAYEKYKTLTRTRERNRKTKNGKPVQIAFDDEEIKKKASVPAFCAQTDLMEQDAEQARQEEKDRLNTILMYGVPRLMAFITEHEGRLSTENGVHYVTLKLYDAALLLLDELERRRNAI